MPHQPQLVDQPVLVPNIPSSVVLHPVMRNLRGVHKPKKRTHGTIALMASYLG
jgi:hypothetical protein